MNKALSERVLRIERLRGSGKFVVGIRDPSLYEGVKVDGCLMTEKQFEGFSELQEDENAQVLLVSIIGNKPEVSIDD